jgi:cobalt-precorrin-5B (C1)-methyltransferase
MVADDMMAFIKEHDIRLIIDATHPFARTIHNTIAEVSKATNVPAVRLQRPLGERYEDVTYCKDFGDAVLKIQQASVNHLLALTGANTIGSLKPLWEKTPTTFRVLNREESRLLAEQQGVDYILLDSDKEPGIPDDPQRQWDAVVMKDSGSPAGMTRKVTEARQRDMRIFIVERPTLPSSFIYVEGEHGLRRSIERLVPEFFPLHTGLTTGACATAATVAAMHHLLYGEHIESASFLLPNGEGITIETYDNFPTEERISAAKAKGQAIGIGVIKKEAGDDPDVTNGCLIVSEVCRNDGGEIRFFGGEGVGTVTLPGLGLPVGEPAINPAPRKMITEAIRSLDKEGGYDVTISVPGGEELAKKTFNSRVGVIGGISIIGTSGIVQPFSNEAFQESIRREISVAKALHTTHVVINSGAKSERIIKEVQGSSQSSGASGARFKVLRRAQAQAEQGSTPNSKLSTLNSKLSTLNSKPYYLHYGNFIGSTLESLRDAEIPNVIMGIMIGKAVKLAEGHLDTHSHKVTMNKPFVLSLAEEVLNNSNLEAAKKAAILSQCKDITLARELWDIFPESLHSTLADVIRGHCLSVCKPVIGSYMHLDILIISESGKVL